MSAQPHVYRAELASDDHQGATRGPSVWAVKAAQVHLMDTATSVPQPADRKYGLIVVRNPTTQEIKYFVSSTSASAGVKDLLTVAFARWHVEKWFERAKQEAGFGAFEVRAYRSLIRHWLCSRVTMYFWATQTPRIREEKSADHTGAGGRGGQYTGVEDMEPLAALLG